MHMHSSLLLLALACGFASINATVVDTVVGSVNHTTLELLVTRAGLVTTLSATNRDFTVFAPTDDAFTALGSSTLVTKLTTDPVGIWLPLLEDVLKYHVLEANSTVLAAALPTAAQEFPTLSTGSALSVKSVAPQITAVSPGVGAATVNIADLTSNNGVVHSINTVLLPPSTQRDVTGIVIGSAAHTTLETLLGSASLVATLQAQAQGSAFTVFAPNDDAFDKLDSATLTCLQDSSNVDLLADLLKFHVVSGFVVSSALTDGQTITPLSTTFTTNSFTFEATGTKLMAGAGEAAITVVDLLANNGVVHVIDTVLVPTGFSCSIPAETTPVPSIDSASSASASGFLIAGFLAALAVVQARF